MNDSWPKYTLTAFAGLVAGLMATFTHMTISNAARVSALEADFRHVDVQLQRIEDKLDKINGRK